MQAVGICTPHDRLYWVFHLTLVPALVIVNSCVYLFRHACAGNSIAREALWSQ